MDNILQEFSKLSFIPLKYLSLSKEGYVNLNFANANHRQWTCIDYDRCVKPLLPHLRFGEVVGDFKLFTSSKLTSLEGWCPHTVSGDFTLMDLPNLTSLKGCPIYIGSNCHIRNCSITSLEHFPSHVGGDITLASLPITSVKGLPSVLKGSLTTFGCDQITSVEGYPSSPESGIHISSKSLTTLHNIHKTCKQVKQSFISSSPIKSNIMGVFMIRGIDLLSLSGIPYEVDRIVRKHMKIPIYERELDVIKQELIDEGFPEYAKF